MLNIPVILQNLRLHQKNGPNTGFIYTLDIIYIYMRVSVWLLNCLMLRHLLLIPSSSLLPASLCKRICAASTSHFQRFLLVLSKHLSSLSIFVVSSFNIFYSVSFIYIFSIIFLLVVFHIVAFLQIFSLSSASLYSKLPLVSRHLTMSPLHHLTSCYLPLF